MIQIDSDSLDARLLLLLLKDVPITLEEAARELKVSVSKLERLVKGLASRGIIDIEGYPDKRYLRLLRRDISFNGTNPSQKKAVKHRQRKSGKGSEKNNSNDIMYQ